MGIQLDYLPNIFSFFLLQQQLTAAVLEQPIWITCSTFHLQHFVPEFLSLLCQFKYRTENKHIQTENKNTLIA